MIALAGDITPENALALVKKYFGGIPPGPPLRRMDAWVPKFDRNIRDEMEDRVPQARIYRVYRVPGWTSADSANLALFGQVLSGSKSAPLDRALVYDKKVATAGRNRVGRRRRSEEDRTGVRELGFGEVVRIEAQQGNLELIHSFH